MQNLKLNIGAGKTFLPGFVNIDRSSKADISLDLNRDRLPFEDSSAGIIFSYHALEHVDNYLFCLGEIYRVLKHGGIFLVGVPYLTLTEYNLVNPYHKNHFNEYSFDFFDPDKLKGSAGEENPVVFKKIFHRFHYMREFRFCPFLIRDWCRRHLLNVVNKIDFGLIAIKNKETILTLPKLKQESIRMYDELLSSRKKYEDA